MAITTNPFKDTTNPDILKANKLGVVYGINKDMDLFGPSLPITREEISIMICRLLMAIYPEFVADITGVEIFSDEDTIANWALESIKYCYKNGIINGVGGGRIDPKGHTTREQGILIIKRTYVKFFN